ncbi:MAG: translation initiation factor [Lentisphaeria bacterium]
MGKKEAPKRLADPGRAADFKVNPFAALNAATFKEAAPTPAAVAPAPAAKGKAAGGAELSAEDRELLHAFGDGSVTLPGAGRTAGGAGTAPVRGRVRFQVQRKGKGGKTVTRVLGLERLGLAEQMELARQLQQALGTGAHFDGDVLELHGDQQARAADWFRKNQFAV